MGPLNSGTHHARIIAEARAPLPPLFDLSQKKKKEQQWQMHCSFTIAVYVASKLAKIEHVCVVT